MLRFTVCLSVQCVYALLDDYVGKLYSVEWTELQSIVRLEVRVRKVTLTLTSGR